jgi:hypothetical protein
VKEANMDELSKHLRYQAVNGDKTIRVYDHYYYDTDLLTPNLCIGLIHESDTGEDLNEIYMMLPIGYIRDFIEVVKVIERDLYKHMGQNAIASASDQLNERLEDGDVSAPE